MTRRSRCCDERSSSRSTSSTPPTATARRSARSSSPRRCIPIRGVSSSRRRAGSSVPARGGGRATAGPSTCAPPARTRCGGCAWTASTCTSCTRRTPTCPTRTPSARWPRCSPKARSATSGSPTSPSSSSSRRGGSSTSSPCRIASTSPIARSPTCSTACERAHIGFIPWRPLEADGLTEPGGVVAEIAERHGATPGQVAIAWLLAHSHVMLPIPGTSSVAHLEENVVASSLVLTDDDLRRLDEAA